MFDNNISVTDISLNSLGCTVRNLGRKYQCSGHVSKVVLYIRILFKVPQSLRGQKNVWLGTTRELNDTEMVSVSPGSSEDDSEWDSDER